MDAERLVKISRENIPVGRRSPGRLKEDGATYIYIVCIFYLF